MREQTAEKVLTWLLRVLGFLACLAIIAVVMPTSWMVAGAKYAGSPFVDNPLNQYLARSLSLLYAMFGVFVLYIARDVRRYRDLVSFMGWLTMVLGIALTAVDFAVGMPASWTWGEGPPTVVFGAVIVWLSRKVDLAGR
ncbi:MAG: hypothetical protein GTN89_12695 [Acidobacteria bacterium]|nr:hypothetical protein [Acidobacteriota bacterium]NIM63863.1 hypothetical protein [Acidobacteriota bacterium]NIO60132.1 hypothetical protein [Acidobacteriota bacterium]NIQ31196.1 hypothetical protein [Acidobacteriota bacterium]NIQ86333.1 hypothetical protein [Acidobacteriota bacterium]